MFNDSPTEQPVTNCSHNGKSFNGVANAYRSVSLQRINRGLTAAVQDTTRWGGDAVRIRHADQLTREVIMATHGPVPARTSALSRERDADRGDRIPVTKGTMFPVSAPDPDPAWHPVAIMLYESYAISGQSHWAQQSDYARLWFVCNEIDAYLTPGMIMEKDPVTRRLVPKVDEETGEILRYPGHKISGQMFAALDSALADLLFSEGARRRARMELEAPKEDDGDAEVLYMTKLEDSLSEF